VGDAGVGDPVGFDDFYRGTRDRVLAYLYAVGGDPAEAQDAAQEAYTRALARWSSVGRTRRGHCPALDERRLVLGRHRASLVIISPLGSPVWRSGGVTC
jgi:sigma-70-like protein